MRGLFITGTGTGVGKSVLSAALIASMLACGERVRPFKPVLSGLDEIPTDPPPGSWPADHVLLGSLAGIAPEQVSPLRYGPAVSPHLAAQLAGEPIDPRSLLSAARAAVGAGAMEHGAGAGDTGSAGDTKRSGSDGTQSALIVEGVGGLLVPLAGTYTVCDLAAELALPVVIAAWPGLGTINHTLLTLRVARAAGLQVSAVVLTPWPTQPSRLESSNRQTIAELGEVAVHTLPQLGGPDPAELARAGARLPWREWLAGA